MPVEEYTIEVRTNEHGEDTIWVCQRGHYEESSVLAGEEFCQLYKPFHTVEEAQAEFPNARVDLEAMQPLSRELPHIAPDWFDPAAAGEAWGEGDY